MIPVHKRSEASNFDIPRRISKVNPLSAKVEVPWDIVVSLWLSATVLKELIIYIYIFNVAVVPVRRIFRGSWCAVTIGVTIIAFIFQVRNLSGKVALSDYHKGKRFCLGWINPESVTLSIMLCLQGHEQAYSKPSPVFQTSLWSQLSLCSNAPQIFTINSFLLMQL